MEKEQYLVEGYGGETNDLSGNYINNNQVLDYCDTLQEAQEVKKQHEKDKDFEDIRIFKILEVIE